MGVDVKTQEEDQFIDYSSPTKVVHVIAPYKGRKPLFKRQRLFLQSVDRAHKENVLLLAAVNYPWSRRGWRTKELKRDARILGHSKSKPFIKDLFDLALEHANPGDWLLYTNVDCAITEDLYRDLLNKRGTVIEYMRQDVEGDPKTLDELFTNKSSLYKIGIDGLAIRARWYYETRDYFQNFLIGAPHWDTTYSGIFRRLIPVRRVVDKLFHPKHKQIWDTNNLGVAGRYNDILYTEAVKYGELERNTISYEPDVTDTAVILVSFGSDIKRIKANSTAFFEQYKQDLYVDFYLVELLCGEAWSLYPQDLRKNVKHIVVRGSDSCRDLFQKECLMNIGWRTALKEKDYEYFIFIDADVYALRLDWFRQIREKLYEAPEKAVQGFRVTIDTRDDLLKSSSLASNYVLDFQTDLVLNPGMCWGLRRSALEKSNGFNPYFIDCAGDSGFVSEFINTPECLFDHYLYKYNWFYEIRRELSFRLQIDCVPIDIVHVYHGDLKYRNYDTFRYALDLFNSSILELVFLNREGLLEWKDPNCIERYIVKKRAEMHTKRDVDRIFEEFGYKIKKKKKLKSSNFSNTLLMLNRGPSKRKSATKFAKMNPVLDVDNNYKRIWFKKEKKTIRRILNVFNPARVYRDNFPFSWCKNIRTKGQSTFIPVVSNINPPALVLEAKKNVRWFIGLLPLQLSWEPMNLTPYKKINFKILVSGAKLIDVIIGLGSISKRGKKYDSNQISLKNEGLKPGSKKHFKINLLEFDGVGGFDLNRVRTIKIRGQGRFTIHFSEVYFE